MILSQTMLILRFPRSNAEGIFPDCDSSVARIILESLAHNAMHVHNSYRGPPSRSTETKSNSMLMQGSVMSKRGTCVPRISRVHFPESEYLVPRVARQHLDCRLRILCIGLSVGRRIL